MKALKFTPDQIPDIVNKSRFATWRLFDDKQLNVGDKVQFINSENGQVFGSAVIDEIIIKRISDLTESDKMGNEYYKDQASILTALCHYYGSNINPESVIKVIKYTFLGKHDSNIKGLKADFIKEAKIFLFSN